MDCMFPENTEIPEKYIRKCIRSIPKQHGFLLEYKNNYGSVPILGINFLKMYVQKGILHVKALVEKQKYRK